MSHGGGDSEVATEPNLTPLLDMVLQLVMFFMMVANFTMEQVNSDIQLPKAQSAKPMDKTEMQDNLYLNVNRDGKVVVTGRADPLEDLAQLKFYLEQQKNDFLEDAKKKGDASGQLKALVIIRGDTNASYKDIYSVLQLCKQIGYRKWQVRAITQAAA